MLTAIVQVFQPSKNYRYCKQICLSDLSFMTEVTIRNLDEPNYTIQQTTAIRHRVDPQKKSVLFLAIALFITNMSSFTV